MIILIAKMEILMDPGKVIYMGLYGPKTTKAVVWLIWEIINFNLTFALC